MQRNRKEVQQGIWFFWPAVQQLKIYGIFYIKIN